jgi:hypothetical protein
LALEELRDELKTEDKTKSAKNLKYLAYQPKVNKVVVNEVEYVPF